MDKRSFVRVWQEVDIGEIEPHLLVAGSTTGDCGKCKEIGISLDAKNCPKCGAQFKYTGTRISSSAVEARRLRARRPDLVLIDFQDFKNVLSRRKARGFLNGGL